MTPLASVIREKIICGFKLLRGWTEEDKLEPGIILAGLQDGLESLRVLRFTKETPEMGAKALCQRRLQLRGILALKLFSRDFLNHNLCSLAVPDACEKA